MEWSTPSSPIVPIKNGIGPCERAWAQKSKRNDIPLPINTIKLPAKFEAKHAKGSYFSVFPGLYLIEFLLVALEFRAQQSVPYPEMDAVITVELAVVHIVMGA